MEAFKQFSLNFTQMFLSSSSFHFVSTHLCPYTFEWFSLNFTQMFILTVGLCEEPIIHYAGSKSRWHFNVMGFTLQFRVWSILLLNITCWTLWTILIKLHPNVLSVWQCAESMTQIPRFKIKVTLQGHVVIYPWISCLLHISPEPFEWFTLNFTQILVRWCAEPMTHLCRLKVNVIFSCN